ncbi:MAG: toxin-antitoxin system YwqK family antitoxin [Planctomycetota bacterium]
MRAHEPSPQRHRRSHAQFSELPFVTVWIVVVLVLVVGLRTGPTSANERDVDRARPSVHDGFGDVVSDVVRPRDEDRPSAEALAPIESWTEREATAHSGAGADTGDATGPSIGDASGGLQDGVRSVPGLPRPVSFSSGGNGVAREEGRFRRGVRHGEWVVVRADGTVAERGEYAEGLRQGLWQTFSSAGALLSEAHFVEGDLHGDWRMYADAGDLVGEGTYSENLRSGRWTLWYSNGSIKERGRYENGLREGLWEFYDDLGRPTLRTGTYRAGIRID